MYEHGYDVIEKDSEVIEKIAEKTEVDIDMLWENVATWANYYGIQQIKDF